MHKIRFVYILIFIQVFLSIPQVSLLAQDSTAIVAMDEKAFLNYFQCPESFPNQNEKENAVRQMIYWAAKNHPEWTLEDFIAFRLKLLKTKGCTETLANITNSTAPTKASNFGDSVLEHKSFSHGNYNFSIHISKDTSNEYSIFTLRHLDTTLAIDTAYSPFFYWFGMPNRSFDSLIPPGKDINADGVPELVVTKYSGGAHCCYSTDIYSMKSPRKPIQSFEFAHDESAHFENLNSDSSLELICRDYSFSYWNSSFAETPRPKVILRWLNGRYRADPTLMKSTVPAIDTVLREGGESQGEFAGMRIGVRYWTAMLELIYTCNFVDAWSILDNLFSRDVFARNAFIQAFLSVLHKSPYYADICKFPNYSEPKTNPNIVALSSALDSLLVSGFINKMAVPTVASANDTITHYQATVNTLANKVYLGRVGSLLRKFVNQKPVISSGRYYESLEGHALLMLRNLGTKNTVHYVPDYIYNEIAYRLKRYEPLAIVSTFEFKEGNKHQVLTPFTYHKSSTYSLSSTSNSDFPLLYFDNIDFYAGHVLILDGLFATSSSLTFQTKPEILSIVKKISPEVAWLNSNGYYSLINQYYAAEDYDAALIHCKKFLELFSSAEEYSAVVYLVARLNHLLSQYNTALDGYRGYLQKYPEGDKTCFANFNIADIYDKHNKPEMALPYFTKALESCGDTTALGRYSKSKIEELSPKKAEEYNNYYNYCR